MTTSAREERFERIVVACDASPVGCAALEAAAALASSLQAELAGLFVEDVNLLRMAALPFTRELGLASGSMRPIEITDIERGFRRHAEQTRKALEGAAVASSLRWSFQVVRGQPLSAVLSAAGHADLVVVGGSVHLAAPRRAARGVRARPVAVLYDGSPRAERVLEVGEALSSGGGFSLAILVPAESEDEFKTWHARVRARLARHEGAARIVWLQGRDLQTLAKAAAAEDAAALLFQDPLDNRELAALLAAVRCPLVLVR